MQVHILSHFTERPYRCNYEGCDWSFASSFKLKRHLETHLNRRDFVVSGFKSQFVNTKLCLYSICITLECIS